MGKAKYRLTAPKRGKKKARRRPISIMSDAEPPYLRNDDLFLYPAEETRFQEWDASILVLLEVQRDLGLSQSDKESWDSALEKMISLRNINNERRRTDIELPRTPANY